MASLLYLWCRCFCEVSVDKYALSLTTDQKLHLQMFAVEKIFQVMRVCSLGGVKSPKTIGVKRHAFH